MKEMFQGWRVALPAGGHLINSFTQNPTVFQNDHGFLIQYYSMEYKCSTTIQGAASSISQCRIVENRDDHTKHCWAPTDYPTTSPTH